MYRALIDRYPFSGTDNPSMHSDKSGRIEVDEKLDDGRRTQLSGAGLKDAHTRYPVK